MSTFDSLIDPTDFGTVAAYLRSPSSPIYFVLHLKERESLSAVAALVEREMETGGFTAHGFPESLNNLIEAGSVKVSPRGFLQYPGAPKWCLDAELLDMNATSYVIYLPPFYIAHTPGLFEKTQADRMAPESLAEKQSSATARESKTKDTTKTKDHGMSH